MKKLLCILLLCCSACGGNEVRDTLGLNRSAPDEFSVVSRPPLTVPPEFYLYPPDEAIARSSVEDINAARDILFDQKHSGYLSHYSDKAKKAVGSDDTAVPRVGASQLPSPAEQALLSKTGAVKADPDIRSFLRQETQTTEAQDPGFFETLREPHKELEPVVDPLKERERLMENKKAGRAPNEGDIPEITPTESLLDKWF